MLRLSEPPSDVTPDVSLLDSLRGPEVPRRPAGSPPFFLPGDLMMWQYGPAGDVMRVVRDDERGLVAWRPAGSEGLVKVPVDGRPIRDRSPRERLTTPLEMAVRRWDGPGLMRIAPTSAPWSVWLFRTENDQFDGYYINLELPHRRPRDGAARIHTSDLILDLWVKDGVTWLKDADELVAAVDVGLYTGAQSEVIHDIVDLARRSMIEPRRWPLDEHWETWRPPSEWNEPLLLPRPQL